MTIPSVLQDINALTDDTTTTNAANNRALIHLSQRVVQLEQQLAQAHAHLRLQRSTSTKEHSMLI